MEALFDKHYAMLRATSMEIGLIVPIHSCLLLLGQSVFCIFSAKF